MSATMSLRQAVDLINDMEGTADPEERRKRQNRARMFYNDGDLQPDSDVSQGKTGQYGEAGVLSLRLTLVAHENGLDRNFIAQMNLFLSQPMPELGAHPATGIVKVLPTNADKTVQRILAGEDLSLIAERYSKPEGPLAWGFRFDPPSVSTLPPDLAEAVAATNAANRADSHVLLNVTLPAADLVRPLLDRMR